MAAFSLERLVHAISSSIIQAQNLAEKAQLGNLRSYFDKDGQAICVDVKVPSLQHHPDQAVFDHYHVPLITLVPHSSLVIKEAEIELDVEIGSIEQEEPPESGYPDLSDIMQGQAPIRPRLTINPEAGVAKANDGNVANISIKLAAAEVPEGIARLLAELMKSQGRVSATPTTPGRPADPTAASTADRTVNAASSGPDPATSATAQRPSS